MSDGGRERSGSLTGRARNASISAVEALMNLNPQPGMWAATGTAIAHAPTITELREPIAGGTNVRFNEHGHSARTVVKDERGFPVLELQKLPTGVLGPGDEAVEETKLGRLAERTQPTLAQQAAEHEKHNWKQTTKHGFAAAWKFVSSPTGFLMVVYGLNIVAWGAMLFFLLLHAAPAMNHPDNGNADSSPRKIWIETDSQILNALFCVTGFGLAPWRFRDLYWLMKIRTRKNKYAMKRLYEQNKAWFRPPAWYYERDDLSGGGHELPEQRVTFTGEEAPPTSLWKLSFVIWMMVLNTLFQACLASFMWAYGRIDRPSWSTGMFIALGCGVSLLAGLMMWWEGRKVKIIEGPVIKVIEAKDVEEDGESDVTA